MTDTTKAMLIQMLDREFDRTLESIARKNRLIESSRSFAQKARYANEAVELEDYANTLYNLAQAVLEA